MQICVGVIDGYLFVYLDMLGAPPALFGACLFAIGCVELPVFTYSGEILDYVGYSGALHLVRALSHSKASNYQPFRASSRAAACVQMPVSRPVQASCRCRDTVENYAWLLECSQHSL